MTMIAVFVQIIQARAADAEALRAHHERWIEDLAPGADGWLGSTAGVSTEGEYIALVRFASAEAARRNSQREEQGVWWSQLEALTDSELTVQNCREVAELAGGGSDEAGLVEIFQGRAPDIHEVLERIAETEEETLPHRPRLIGGYIVAHGEGPGFTEVLYYPSEEAAEDSRAENVREQELSHIEEMTGAITDLRRIELLAPWLHSA